MLISLYYRYRSLLRRLRTKTLKQRRAAFEKIQQRLWLEPGEAGARRRREAYKPFFLRMGAGVHIEPGCLFTHPDHIVLDDGARINREALFFGSGGIWIGRNVRVGPRSFIHSANHDTHGKAAMALFEAGYTERPVMIGDNCLLSANVMIMPGAYLEESVFVAAGALVAAGRYVSGGTLRGLPASLHPPKAKRLSRKGEPSVVLLTPRTKEWKDKAHHLAIALRMPQVGVIAENERLPSSARAAIAFGPQGWSPRTKIPLWTFAEPDKKAAFADSTITLVRGHDLQPPRHKLAVTLFWSVISLEKQTGRLTLAQAIEWMTTIILFGLLPGRTDQLAERITKALVARAPYFCRGRLTRLCRAAPDAFPNLAKSILLSLLRLEGFSQRVQSALSRLHMHKVVLTRLLHKAFASWSGSLGVAPRLLARQLTGAQEIDAKALNSDDALAREITAKALLAALLGRGALFSLKLRQLRAEPFSLDVSAFPVSREGSTSYFYSPLVAVLAWWSTKGVQPMAALPEGAFPRQDIERLCTDWEAATPFVDLPRRVLDRGLISDWFALHTAPTEQGWQFLLEDSAYRPLIPALEKAWLQVLRAVFSELREPLLQVNPWPHPYTAALALRYDVDRPVTPLHINGIARIEREHFNAALSSWFYFPEDVEGANNKPEHSRHWHEIGYHAKLQTELQPDLGVTHHSAPNSLYWQGETTLAFLKRKGSGYGEFLAAQIGIPRRAWLESPVGGSRIGTWITPIHFPLERSTKDQTLEYFNLRRDRFRALLSAGGLGIIGSHSDLDQDLLIEIVQSEDFESVWMTTVGRAVARCQKVLDQGSISVLHSDAGELMLASRRDLADFSVTVFAPGAELAATVVLQLRAGVPRVVPLPNTPPVDTAQPASD